jgi:hypothetical protein
LAFCEKKNFLIVCYYLSQVFLELVNLLPQSSSANFLLLIGEYLGVILGILGISWWTIRWCNSSTWEAEAGEPRLQSKLKKIWKKKMVLCCY